VAFTAKPCSNSSKRETAKPCSNSSKRETDNPVQIPTKQKQTHRNKCDGDWTTVYNKKTKPSRIDNMDNSTLKAAQKPVVTFVTCRGASRGSVWLS